MDLDKFARKIQNYLQNNPLVVLGSGSSVPFGLPTMGFLSTILKDTQFLRDNNCQQFLKNLDCMGLEDAINCSELSDEIKELIRIQHFTTFMLSQKLTKLLYTRPELSLLNFLRHNELIV